MVRTYALPLHLAMSVLILLASPSLAGEKGCSQSMEITDLRFSVTSEVGVPVTFSDIGCAMAWRDFQCFRDQTDFDAHGKVRDYFTEEEIAIVNAFFVLDAGIQTPLGFDVAAFRSREAADKFVAEKGKGTVLTYSDLLERKFY